MLENFLLAFIPVFVAVDAIGVLPIFVSFTHDLSEKEKSRVILQSMATALGLAIGFIFLGKAVFQFLSITISDFMIAGGAVLFIIAVTDLVNPEKTRRTPGKELGVVPLGTPLIAGPAVLTTSLIIIGQYGFVPTVVSVVSNVLLAGLIFHSSHILIKFLGELGAKALSKVTSLLLGAIAIMMIRRGIMQFIAQL